MQFFDIICVAKKVLNMIQNSLLNNKISYMVACVSSFASVFVEDLAEICRQNRNWQIRLLGSTERVLLMCICIICRKLRVKLVLLPVSYGI